MSEESETLKKLLGEKYLLRVLLLQLLGNADLTLEEPENGFAAIRVKLHECEFTWTGPGVYWIKDNLSYKIKNINEEKCTALKENTYIQWSGTGLEHPKGFKKEE